ncbi:cytidyltransferase-related domain [Methanoregula boonei 6A8]|jgi:pantetheine-phosphate adenylyltransferase|uniref:Phosphopantetheine adenylyltransferase n=1 Tax=Methanoregula boonei (strain DSM 21154 / JCM 14090 / 6A8) TaxID=456442 RepID=A7I9E1_METB6|nr:phosphopantetheine adenylyltransferase [Methanoregula boonei]ABS56352.1 cytidyltransferase-related domain [Methanoregula boonei 6A8]
MKVMVGGTFDPLHDGHKRLLTRSFELAGPGGKVVIGLTTDPFASRKTHPIHPFAERRADLEKFITGHIIAQIPERKYATLWEIEPLSDRFGSALDADFDAIVVSEETLPVAVEINKMRREKNLRKVDIHQITCVLAEDGRWISSTRIWRGEIDVHGHLIHSPQPE